MGYLLRLSLPSQQILVKISNHGVFQIFSKIIITLCLIYPTPFASKQVFIVKQSSYQYAPSAPPQES